MIKNSLGFQVEHRLRDVIAEYVAEGYSVVPPTKTSGIPPEILDLDPDVILRLGETTVVVEVMSASEPADNRLEALAYAVNQHADWSLALVWVGSTPAPLPSRKQIYRTISDAWQVAKVSDTAALLLGWSAVESALDLLLHSAISEDADRIEKAKSSKEKASLAESLGLISEPMYELLSTAAELRNSVAHRVPHAALPTISELLKEVLDAASLLAREGYASPFQMIDWFRERYVEPVEILPFDSREGGYQYFAGGPYDALEVLQENFPEAEPRDVAEAASQLERESDVWIRREDYSL